MVATLSQNQIFLQIGQVAEQSGVPIKTIRYYEELGLLKSSGRTDGKFRLFVGDVIKRLAFIKKLQKLGLRLREIAEILQVYDRGLAPCNEIKQQLENQVTEIDRRIAELIGLRSEIKSLLKDWTSTERAEIGEICPILQKDEYE